jgi:hypothetical protein
MPRNRPDFNAPATTFDDATFPRPERSAEYGEMAPGGLDMTRSSIRTLFIAAALAATVATPLSVCPAFAQDDGVSVTIRKGPSYLNTRTTPNPGSSSRAAYDTNAQYQPVFRQRNSVAFSRYPLPSSFDVPGY